jgi:hypothetical protein
MNRRNFIQSIPFLAALPFLTKLSEAKPQAEQTKLAYADFDIDGNQVREWVVTVGTASPDCTVTFQGSHNGTDWVDLTNSQVVEVVTIEG